jgi:hypothetical protein
MKNIFDVKKKCPNVALNGYFKVLKQVIEIGCPFSDYIYYEVTLDRHLQMLKRARVNDYH